MDTVSDVVKQIVRLYHGERSKLLDIVRDVQAEVGLIDVRVISRIAEEMRIPAMDVADSAAFYNFFYKRLCIAFI
jgi:NADH:ubiquinone oxidoreductase subunit E